MGLEIADTGANGATGGYYDLIMLTDADHIIFDRCWIHGSPIGEDVKGVEFSSSSYIGVIDSYISDIHSKVLGYGADSAAIGSVTGTGPVKIVDNFLEASGENVLWGGGASATNVTDVELRRNHMFKPFTWWRLSPTYLGTLFVVKNLFENKTGVRELVEGNIFENNWAQSQKGTAILFYPRNQTGKCPECTVHDVIFRYNIVRHAETASRYQRATQQLVKVNREMGPEGVDSSPDPFITLAFTTICSTISVNRLTRRAIAAPTDICSPLAPRNLRIGRTISRSITTPGSQSAPARPTSRYKVRRRLSRTSHSTTT